MTENTGTRRPLALGLALLFLLVLLAGLGARFWAANRIIGASGPTHIATDGETVLLFAAGNLLQLSGAGELQAVIPFARTGLSDDPVDLRFLRDGRLLVATQRPATVRLCTVATWDCQASLAGIAERIERQFKIVEGARAEEWLLTDARGDTLWRLSPAGPAEAVVPAGTLAGPNALALAGDGALWVADTDHRRLVELVPDGAGGFTAAREHSAVNEYTVGRTWFPMMLARMPDGRWWVTQAAEFSEDRAELMVYDPAAGAQARVALPPGAYPTDIVSHGDAVLVTDMDRYAVYRVAADTLAATPFGDDRLLEHLGQVRQQRDHLEQLSGFSLVAVIASGVLMLAAAVLATPREKRWTRAAPPFDLDRAPAETPRVTGIHWLKPDAAFERSVKWAERVAYVSSLLPVLAVLVLLLVMQSQQGAAGDAQAQLNEVLPALLASGALAVLLIPLLRKSFSVLRTRVGTDGKRLYIRRPDGRQIAVEPADLGYTGRMLLYREYRLPLIGGKQKPIYASGEIETWLGPLLREARRLSTAEAVRHLWRHRDNRLWLWLVGAAVLLAVALALLERMASIPLP